MYITLSECKKGYLYELHSRNLTYGVYNGDEGFIGIREKFGDRFLFIEFHWDQGPPFGTVKPIEEIGPIPKNIELVCNLPIVDRNTKRPVSFDSPVRGGGKGWFYLDTGETSEKIVPYSPMNIDLFKYLDQIENSK